MDIDIKNDNVDWGNYVDKFPAIMTQSAKTTVKAKNGETVVIGGMYKVETGSTKNTVPLLFKIPILGNLFKSTVRSSQQRETLIFITPRIVK
jgi:type IV pilus assembly protein PilQ